MIEIKCKALSASWRMGFCFFIVVVSVFIFYSCSNETKEVKTVKVSTPQDLEKETVNQLSSFLTKDSIISIDSIPLTCYRYFNTQYNNKLLWFDKNNFNQKGDSLLKLIEKINYYGLIPNNYHLQKIKNHIDSIHANKELINVTSLVKADLLLSDAYFLMGAHLNKGRFYTDSLLL
ncbi:MAG: hypothetical protein IPH32_11475 [Bacteroidetes bacterium]|nr:hypothetical protein [Bacteroidota bacterium]